jgi:short-subunit dehydrogenase
VAIVTGASEGIGRAIAVELGKRGAKVVLAARAVGNLNKVEKEIPGSVAFTTDMRESRDIRKLVEHTMENFGRVDILVNNAGQGLRAPIERIAIEDYKEIFELNVVGVLRAMQEVIPIMRKQGKGTILNISSQVTRGHIPDLAGYSSTKYALNSLTLTARQELAKDGIVVCNFYPTLTATNFGQNARGEKYDSRTVAGTADQPQDVAAAVCDQIESGEAEAFM